MCLRTVLYRLVSGVQLLEFQEVSAVISKSLEYVSKTLHNKSIA